jgi:MOSC domain-containing protein YiiM
MTFSVMQKIHINQIFTGKSQILPGGHASGIIKHAVNGPVELTREGLVGDVQADRRFHGGVDKAVHHYAAENYSLLQEYFPEIETAFVPGSIGENISTLGWDETTVCVGDIFQIGACKVQVSQPRAPCWKINARYGMEDISRFVEERGIAGWYYRVVQTGVMQAGDEFTLVERNPDPISVREFWRVFLLPRPELGALIRIGETPGLNAEMSDKINQRLDWLRKN